MYANDPDMAAKWQKDTPKGKKLPKYAPKKKKKKANYLATIVKTASFTRVSSREYQHCPVCGAECSAIGVHGPSKKYECNTCKYHFSNK